MVFVKSLIIIHWLNYYSHKVFCKNYVWLIATIFYAKYNIFISILLFFLLFIFFFLVLWKILGFGCLDIFSLLDYLVVLISIYYFVEYTERVLCSMYYDPWRQILSFFLEMPHVVFFRFCRHFNPFYFRL